MAAPTSTRLSTDYLDPEQKARVSYATAVVYVREGVSTAGIMLTYPQAHELAVSLLQRGFGSLGADGRPQR